MIGRRLPGLALALLTAIPASAIPPAIPEPQEVHPFTFEGWTGGCTDMDGCGAYIPWGEGRIQIVFEAPRAIPPPLRPGRTYYRLTMPCPTAREVDLWKPFDAPLDQASDVAAHLRAAIETGTFGCWVKPLDDETDASITRLVGLFTLVAGVRVQSHDLTVAHPNDSAWNHHSLNPDIWIDEVADYPETAKQSRQGGAVETELAIRSDSGLPIICTVLRTSGVAALDEGTCRLLLRRARFAPGAGPRGHSRYVIRTVWDISKVVVPLCMGTSCKVGPDGRFVKDQTFMYKPGPNPVGVCETPYCTLIPGRHEQ